MASRPSLVFSKKNKNNFRKFPHTEKYWQQSQLIRWHVTFQLFYGLFHTYLFFIKRIGSLLTSAHLWTRGVGPVTIFCGQYLPTKTNAKFNQPSLFSCFCSLDKLTDNLICSFFQFQSIRASQRLFFRFEWANIAQRFLNLNTAKNIWITV